MTDHALSDAEFSDLLTGAGAGLCDGPVVGCSGGPDSMALTLLLRRWVQAGREAAGTKKRKRLDALIVDHGLRSEAAQEAEQVARTLRDIGVEATVLHYSGPRPTRDIQAAAREIRFRLMLDWMTAHGRTDLFLAHHQEDQAETVMLRLARGSGVDGLSAMAVRGQRDGIAIIRPLLPVPKARLEATVAAAGVPVVRDPSNSNDGFARVRLRKLAAALAGEGLTPARLARTAGRMARARVALESARDRFIQQHVACHAEGFVVFEAQALASLPEEIGLRVLSHVIRVIGANRHPAREGKLEALYQVIAGNAVKAGRTLAGTKVVSWHDRIVICREKAAMSGAVPVAQHLVWDGRFECRFGPVETSGLSQIHIGPLYLNGAKKVPDSVSAQLAALPAPVRPTVPALWSDTELLSVPHLGYCATTEELPGRIAFRSVSAAWGGEFRRSLPFSNVQRGPM